MKRLSTSQWVLGGGIIALIYVLYKKQQGKTKTYKVVKDVVVENTSSNKTETKSEQTKTDGAVKKLDVSGVPAQCLGGFVLNGKKYSIKNNNFVKE